MDGRGGGQYILGNLTTIVGLGLDQVGDVSVQLDDRLIYCVGEKLKLAIGEGFFIKHRVEV